MAKGKPLIQAHFSPIAQKLGENGAKIIEELNAAQGRSVDLGGYYRPTQEKAEKAMRPSATFNALLGTIALKR